MKTEADIRNAMGILPNDTLYDLYEDNLTQIKASGQHTRQYATQVFSLLLCAEEALSPKALIQATARTTAQQRETMTMTRILDICFNLIALDSEMNVLRFAHTSFQDYLKTKIEFSSHNVHEVAATTCLQLCLEGLPSGMESGISSKDDFYHYSAVYWAKHCSIALIDGDNTPIITRLRDFVFDEEDVSLGFIDWMQEVGKIVENLSNHHGLAKQLSSVMNSNGSPLFTACAFGLAPILGDLEREINLDWNQTNDLGQSGLYLAAATGHHNIVQTLLELKADINTSGGKFNRPLHAACFGGHTFVVNLLLEHGADPKAGPESALEYAILADHEDIALTLLDGNFDITNQAEYDSITQRAAEAGFADVTRLLQKQYTSRYGGLGSSRCKAVEVAILKGRTEVVERYMQKMKDPKIEMPDTAIATAALGGQDGMIHRLLDHGLDLNKEGPFGTPLRAACIMGNESTVRLLLRISANTHSSGSFGDPLQAAAMRGHEIITRTLLSHGAEVNSKGGLYGTALQAAAHRGHQRVVEILLEAGANVYQKGFSRDAFHAASEGGHEEIIRLLIERGFHARQPPPTPMYHKHLKSPYRDLLRDASPSRPRQADHARNHPSRPEHWNVQRSPTDSSHVEKKVRGDAASELEAIESYSGRNGYLDRNKNYALRAAAAKGHDTVVKLLLSQLGTAGIRQSEIVAAFQEACENGHETVVIQLLSDHLKAEALEDALEAAALNGHLNVVNLLIDHEHRHALAPVETASIRRPRSKGKDVYISSGADSHSSSDTDQFTKVSFVWISPAPQKLCAQERAYLCFADRP